MSDTDNISPLGLILDSAGRLVNLQAAAISLAGGALPRSFPNFMTTKGNGSLLCLFHGSAFTFAGAGNVEIAATFKDPAVGGSGGTVLSSAFNPDGAHHTTVMGAGVFDLPSRNIQAGANLTVDLAVTVGFTNADDRFTFVAVEILSSS